MITTEQKIFQKLVVLLVPRHFQPSMYTHFRLILVFSTFSIDILANILTIEMLCDSISALP